MMKDLLYLGIWNYWRCMHSVLVRNYRYKYSREGIIPGTWYLDFLLDPCSISLDHFVMNRDKMIVDGTVKRVQDQDGKEEYDNYFFRRTEKNWVFTMGEDMEITDIDRARYAEEFQMSPNVNLIQVYRYCTLVIDGTEYNNQYVREHLNDLRILLDQIRTDMLLEDMDV